MNPDSVRPNNEDDDVREDGSEGEFDGVEHVKANVRDTGKEPSTEEAKEHNVDHAELRSWCPHCVKGKSVSLFCPNFL